MSLKTKKKRRERKERPVLISSKVQTGKSLALPASNLYFQQTFEIFTNLLIVDTNYFIHLNIHNYDFFGHFVS
jgi:hypothetical protein